MFNRVYANTSFANAPSAELYGLELDAVYGIDLYSLGGSFFETKQLLIIANYTYTQSSLSVGAADISPVPGNIGQLASQIFDDGAPLVGQSDHLANLSLGIEDLDKVQQLTVLYNYASERVTLRGGALPDDYTNKCLDTLVCVPSVAPGGRPPATLERHLPLVWGRW